MKQSFHRKLLLCLVGIFTSYTHIEAVRYIFQWPSTQAGDNLVALYNAYVYAKKYNLTLAVAPFNHFELFECYNKLPHLPGHLLNNREKLIEVTNEKDLIKNLCNTNVHFYLHVHSQRLPTTKKSAAEAKKLLKLNKSIDLDYLKKDISNKDATAFTIAVHIRKGNGGGQIYDGELTSEQIFDFDRSLVHYCVDKTGDPFHYFEAEEQFACTKQQFCNLNNPDIVWTTKFPPEQYYIDQIKKIAADKDTPIVVHVFTDDKDPLALLARLKQNVSDEHITFAYYDNREKGYKQMIVEDLYLMSQCDALIRSTSRFSIVAQVIGSFKTVIYPIRGTWLNNKQLIINEIVIRNNTSIKKENNP